MLQKNETQTPGYNMLNLSASYRINEHMQFKAQALNVLNERDILYKAGEDSITEVSESTPQFYAGFVLRY